MSFLSRPPDPVRDSQIDQLMQFLRGAEQAYFGKSRTFWFLFRLLHFHHFPDQIYNLEIFAAFRTQPSAPFDACHELRLTDRPPSRSATFAPQHQVEIEFRIGYSNQQTRQFVPSLSSSGLFHMLKLVLGKLFRRSTNEESIDANLAGATQAKRLRWKCVDHVDPNFEEKHKINQAPMNSSNAQQMFATRMSANVEQPSGKIDVAGHAEVILRKKMRRRFYPYKSWLPPTHITDKNYSASSPIVLNEVNHPLRDALRIDLTEVRQASCTYAEARVASNVNFDTSGSTFELEIEIMPATLKAIGFGSKTHALNSRRILFMSPPPPDLPSLCRKDPAPERRAIVAHIVDFLRDLHVLIQQVNMDHKFADVFLQPVYDHIAFQQLIDRFNAALNRPPGANPFPGCMPVGFFRKHLAQLKESKYWVSEKTDGLRYLMLLTKDRGPGVASLTKNGAVYLVNRSMEFYQVRGKLVPSLVDAVASDGDTIIDGELVRNTETFDPCFLAYDVLQFSDCNLVDSPYTTRLMFVKQFVEKWQALCPRGASAALAECALPFRITRKNVVPVSEVARVFSKIAEHPGGVRIFKDDAMKQCHPTDGLIFCPDGPYEFGSQTNLFKWKYSDKLTVDLRVIFVSNEVLHLFARGRSEPYEAKLVPLDVYRLHKDLSTLARRDIIICEFGLEGEQWRYHLIRKDKNESNWIGTVTDTLAAISENLGGEEIIHSLSDP